MFLIIIIYIQLEKIIYIFPVATHQTKKEVRLSFGFVNIYHMQAACFLIALRQYLLQMSSMFIWQKISLFSIYKNFGLHIYIYIKKLIIFIIRNAGSEMYSVNQFILKKMGY